MNVTSTAILALLFHDSRRRLLTIGLCLGLAVPLTMTPSPVRAAKRTVKGAVRYETRECRSAGVGGESPLAGVRLEVWTDSNATTTRLSKNGTFSASVKGGGPIKGKLIFEGQRMKVAPDPGKAGPDPDTPTLQPTPAYQVRLGRLTPGNLIDVSENTFVLSKREAAVANIWTVLNDAATFAHKNSPESLGKVTAIWRYDKKLETFRKINGSSYVSEDRAIYIGGRAEPTGDEWEPVALTHEYGHHVMQELFPPPNSSGDHHFTTVHPNKPGLPWSEGFAHGFAGITLKQGVLEVNCDEEMNIAATPATPAPENPALAQYNETRTAGVIHQLNAAYDLERLLTAWHAFKEISGHHPKNLREARDALIVASPPFEEDEQTHVNLTKFFSDQEIGWGIAIAFDWARGGSDRFALNESVDVEVTGPGSFSCEPPDSATDSRGTIGGLSHTFHDDCGMNEDVSYEEQFGSARWSNLFIGYPHLNPNGSHVEGDFTFKATYSCTDNDPSSDASCPATKSGTVTVVHYADLDPDYDIHFGSFCIPSPAHRPCALANQIDVPVTTQTAVGTNTSLVTFNGRGECTIVGDIDCTR